MFTNSSKFINNSYLKAVNALYNKNVKYKYLDFLKKSGGGTVIEDFEYDIDTTEEDGEIHVFIGNKKNCILGRISSETPHILLLQNFSYYRKCNITKNLEPKTGTSRMMKTFLQYVASTLSQIKIIELSDDSGFNCGDTKIYHYVPYLFKYGCGYYEYHFGFNINPVYKFEREHNTRIYKKLVINKKEFIEYIKDLDNSKNNIDVFLSYLQDGELITTFMKTFKIPDYLCELFNKFIMFIKVKYGIIGLDGITYSNTIEKLLEFNNIKKLQHLQSKLTLKKQHSISQRTTKTRKFKRHHTF